MKKLLIASCILLYSEMLCALPLGNPSEPALFSNGAIWCGNNADICDPCFNWCDAFSLRLGFYGDYVFNRGLKFTVETLEKDTTGDGLDTYTMFTNAGNLTLNFFNRLDVFTTLGETKQALKTNFANVSAPLTGEGEIIFRRNFSWSVGGRALLYSWRCLDFGIEGQYFRTKMTTTREIDYVSGLVEYRDVTPAYHREWQVGGGASLHFATPDSTVELIPYVGVKGSWTHHSTFGGAYQLDAARTWGFATGMTLTLMEAVGVTVEGRFGDEKAISVLGEFRF